ncbi:hypothetical protein [Paraburkholderia bannensis]|uniref:hypothetical protein n=1 Tax=Paraburkholderia bannensis TaxID=765414 RepID=UPI002AB795B9|nr:hypothetical protein [Paraburkholderia bannensis]
MHTPSTTPPFVGASERRDSLDSRGEPGARALARPGYGALAAVLAVLAAGAVIGGVYGFLSPDSWHYLFLTQSLRHGLGCTEQGAYFAIFPCGYPLVIALVSPFTDLASLLITSKIANLALLFATFILLARSPLGVLTATLLVLNTVALRIFQFTWSENLFLFAFAASLASVAAIHRDGKFSRRIIWLALWLAIGCSSRYVFGPFAAAMFVAIACAWGWKTALRVLPAFAAAGGFYLAYQAFNVAHTGFGTGAPRAPALESFAFLGYMFVHASLRILAPLGATALVLLVLARVRFAPQPLAREALTSDAGRAHRFLLYAGVGYLIVQFMIRSVTQFDIFYPRTIGYGYAFLLAGAAGIFLRVRGARVPAYAIALYGFASLFVSQGPEFAVRLLHAPAEHNASTIGALERYHSAPTDARLIVNFITPRLNPTADGANALYYPAQARVVTPHTAPYEVPESLDAFRARLPIHTSGSCVLDFTRFASKAEFSEYVDEQFPVGVRAFHGLSTPQYAYRDVVNPSMRTWLWSRFEPGRYVDCGL